MPTENVFPNAMKTTTDVGETMSDVEKIISDIIQTTSEIILALCNMPRNKTLY